MDMSLNLAGSSAAMAASRARIEMLILQPTPFCNINCSYCYLADRQVKAQMSEATLARLSERVFGSGLVRETLSIVWHAGEPLVLPPAYYDRAFQMLRDAAPAGVALTHSLQTNGTLIDEAWVDLFRRWEVAVGLSLDGPRALHDAHRRTRRGGGTYDAAMRGLGLLRARGIEFGVLTVLTAESLRVPDALFDFYLSNGIRRVAFNVEEIEGVHRTSSLDRPDAVEAYRSFLRRFLELRRRHQVTLEIRELDAARAAIIDPTIAEYGNPLAEPLRVLNVDVYGNFSTFSPELLGVRTEEYGDFWFGNVHTGDLDAMLTDAAFGKVEREIRHGVRRCRESCPYFAACGGGAPANKLFENASFDSTETLFCRLNKQAVIDIVLADLEQSRSQSSVTAAQDFFHPAA